MANPKISIIIPVYNTEKFLPTCLNSVISQQVENLEVICINDGSTDKSVEILSAFASKYENIKILNQNNQGVSKSRNLGLQQANGDYVLFLDSDDWYAENALKEIYERAIKDDLDIVCFNVANYDNETEIVTENQFYPPSFWPNDWKTAVYTYENYENIFIGNFSVANKLYKKSFLEKHNIKFIENLSFEDHPFHLKSFLLAEKIGVINKSLYFYRKNVKTSFMGSIKTNQKIYDIFEILSINKKILEELNLYETYRTIFLEYYISITAEMYLKSTSLMQKPKFYSIMQKNLRNIDANDDDKNAAILSSQLVLYLDCITHNWLIYLLKYNVLEIGIKCMQKLRDAANE